jgi:hypothetical protein
MKSFTQFITEAKEKTPYEKAWEKHSEEIDHLKANKFEAFSQGNKDKTTGDSITGVERHVYDKDKSRGVEHQHQITWHHNNMTRKNHKVKTYEIKTEYAGTPRSRIVNTVQKDHDSLHAAVKYLNAKHKEVSGKPFKA